MSTAQEIMDRAATAIAANSAAASAIGATYRFNLEGDHGGSWLVSLKDEPSITQNEGLAECTIKMTSGDFVDLMEGQVQGQDLFFAGKLQIEGDMALAMKLQALTDLMS